MQNDTNEQLAVPTRVVVVGLGYVGCVTAACLSTLGHDVIGVDRDEHKVSAVNSGSAPFFEPGLKEVIERGVSHKCLRASSDLESALKGAAVVLICVGTPSEKNGNLGLTQVRRVVDELGTLLRESADKPVVAIRSTVFPGTCEEHVMAVLGRQIAVVSNPEFLREGTAVKDFIEPSLIVVGGEDLEAVERVAGLYRPLGFPISKVSLRTAEMIKYACNSFHAVKIAFANEIGALSGKLGVDGQEVMDTVCQDVKLNASAAYLRPGFAFGGSCLPKDLRALTYRAGRLDLSIPLLDSVLPSNINHLQRGIDQVLELPGKIGIIGLAFKEDTDDLRESPVVSMLEQLIGKGKDVRVFDPHIQIDAIYGSNRNFILQSIPHISRLMVGGLTELLRWSDQIVLAQKQRPEVLKEIAEAALPVTNLTVAPEIGVPSFVAD